MNSLGVLDHKLDPRPLFIKWMDVLTQDLAKSLKAVRFEFRLFHAVALKFARHLDNSAVEMQRCRDACKMLGQYDQYNIQSRIFETSRDLVVRRLTP